MDGLTRPHGHLLHSLGRTFCQSKRNLSADSAAPHRAGKVVVKIARRRRRRFSNCHDAANFSPEGLVVAPVQLQNAVLRVHVEHLAQWTNSPGKV